MPKGEIVASWKGKEYTLRDLLWLAVKLICCIPAVSTPLLAILIIVAFLFFEADAFFIAPILIYFLSLILLVLSFVITRFLWRWRLGSFLFSVLSIPVTLYVVGMFTSSEEGVSFEGHERDFEEVAKLITAAPIPPSPIRKPREEWKFEVVTSFDEARQNKPTPPGISYILHVTPFADTTLDFSLDRDLRDPGLWTRRASVSDTLIARAVEKLTEMKVRAVFVQGNWIQFVTCKDEDEERGYLFLRDQTSAQRISAANSGTLQHIEGAWYSYGFP